ncbi:dynamin family protein [Bacteroides congonensis]|uniref:dynamin family protein n=2 Tax=Bacteroides TaxID=816 RepID=UPI0023F883D1|nr:dynamin family protein [Bacteroides congonensis]
MPEGQILINPYAVSPRRAIRLMSDICSGRPDANVETLQLSLDAIVGSVFDKDWIAGNASKIGTPLFFNKLFKLTARLAFAISNDFFGNYKRVRVTVTGITFSGKSSLINFLLQRPDLLPVSKDPSTIIPTHIYCNKRKILTRAYAINHCNALIPVNLKAISGIQHTTDSSNESMGRGLAEQISSAMYRFVVECPSDHFNDIEFIDLPGFNANDADDAAALRSLDTSDVILFLMDTSACIGQTDMDILQRINKPILLVANCNNKLKTRQQVIDNFTNICSSVKDFNKVIDCVCLSSTNPEKYGFLSRSGGEARDVYKCMKQAINKLVSQQQAHTEIDSILDEIKQLFLKEIVFQETRKKSLEGERATINTFVTSKFLGEYTIRHKSLPKEVSNLIYRLSNSCTVLQEDHFYDEICYLLNYFNKSEQEKDDRYSKLFTLYTEAIEICSNVKNKLDKLYDAIQDWYKSRRDTLGIDKVTSVLPSSYGTVISPFDAADDVGDYELEQLIEALSTDGGFNVLHTYNNTGHSLMTYAAYRGNIPALMLIISSLGKSKDRLVRTADREGRNILHAAAEGGNGSLFLNIKDRYPVLISKKDVLGRTPEEILHSKVK